MSRSFVDVTNRNVSCTSCIGVHHLLLTRHKHFKRLLTAHYNSRTIDDLDTAWSRKGLVPKRLCHFTYKEMLGVQTKSGIVNTEEDLSWLSGLKALE